jgi:RNA polymerase sigma-70 factor (ECF subfamily)
VVDFDKMPDAFPTTRWSVVYRAKQRNGDSLVACKWLCERYYYPVYAYLRRRQFSEDVAEDLLHGFFTAFLERKRPWADTVGRVDPNRGITFRRCVMRSLKDFVFHDRKGQVQSHHVISFDAMSAEQRYLCEPASVDSPEDLFERTWATQVVSEALKKTREGYPDERFEALQVYLQSPGPQYADTAQRLGITVIAVRQAVHRLRQRYATFISRIITETVDKPEDVDTELTDLISALKNKSAQKP